MDPSQLLIRTKYFALEIIKFFQSLPKSEEAKILGKQLLRCGTSVSANYRAACRARSDQEFYSKLCIVVEESDETLFWLELIKDSGISESSHFDLAILMKEAEELLHIFSASRRTIKSRLTNKSTNQKISNS